MFDLLSGLKIIDLTTIVLGPYATQILGDLGAEVIKVESPEGDLFRAVRPGRQPDVGVQFQNFNRNKRAVCIDLKREAGQHVLHRLVRDADVVVHNMRSRSARALGADFETLRRINPRLVYCFAAGFGDAGPDRDDPAYDDIIQARSGLAALNAGSDGEPRFVPSIVCDKVVGLHLAIAVLAGVAKQREAGAALRIEAPMLETMTSFVLSEHLAGQTLVPPEGGYGYARLTSPNRRPYRTRDGFLAILPYSTRHWQRFFRAAGREDLAEDPRVTDAEQRSLHIDSLYAEVARLALTRSSAEWLETLKAEDVPCARVNTLDELEHDPHLAAVGIFEELTDDTLGAYRQLRSPFRVGGKTGEASPETTGRRAPRLGEHSVEVLEEAGYAANAIEALLEAGVLVAR
jgi:crotonobetainyl-CoA:carnitine CoA-transferase CaiB-like acyl-CoA transferase